jgi:hypothetical protein
MGQAITRRLLADFASLNEFRYVTVERVPQHPGLEGQVGPMMSGSAHEDGAMGQWMISPRARLKGTVTSTAVAASRRQSRHRL